MSPFGTNKEMPIHLSINHIGNGYMEEDLIEINLKSILRTF